MPIWLAVLCSSSYQIKEGIDKYFLKFSWLAWDFGWWMTPKTNERSKNFILKNFWSVTLTVPCKGWCISMPIDSQMITKKDVVPLMWNLHASFINFLMREKVYILNIYFAFAIFWKWVCVYIYIYIYIIIYIICISVFSKEWIDGSSL